MCPVLLPVSEAWCCLFSAVWAAGPAINRPAGLVEQHPSVDLAAVSPGWTAAAAAALPAVVEGEQLVGPQTSRIKSQKVASGDVIMTVTLSLSPPPLPPLSLSLLVWFLSAWQWGSRAAPPSGQDGEEGGAAAQWCWWFPDPGCLPVHDQEVGQRLGHMVERGPLTEPRNRSWTNRTGPSPPGWRCSNILVVVYCVVVCSVLSTRVCSVSEQTQLGWLLMMRDYWSTMLILLVFVLLVSQTLCGCVVPRLCSRWTNSNPCRSQVELQPLGSTEIQVTFRDRGQTLADQSGRRVSLLSHRSLSVFPVFAVTPSVPGWAAVVVSPLLCLCQWRSSLVGLIIVTISTVTDQLLYYTLIFLSIFWWVEISHHPTASLQNYNWMVVWGSLGLIYLFIVRHNGNTS